MATVYLFYLYYMESWPELANPETIPDQRPRHELLYVARHVSNYRAFSIAAFGWAAWAYRGRPRWAGGLALAVALPTLLL